MNTKTTTRNRWALPWIIAAVLILALLGYLWYLSKRDVSSKTVPARQETSSVVDHDSRVRDYVSFIDTGDQKMTLEHTFTNTALHKLEDAIKALGEQTNVRFSSAVDSIDIYADRITVDQYAVSHANDIRRAFDLAGAALMQLQEAKFPALRSEAEMVPASAGSIDPDKMTLDQRQAVKQFFKASADIIRKMDQ